MNNQEKKINVEKNILNEAIENKKEKIEDIILLQNKKIDNLKLQLLENQKKINDIELRKLANIENIKKNTEEKIKKIKKTETEKCLKKIIPIIDSLEEILRSHKKLKDTPFIQGIELTIQSLFNILEKLNVVIEGKKNQLFNSNVHDAILIESSENIPNNHIIYVHKKGFTLNKVILRKATVTISKN